MKDEQWTRQRWIWPLRLLLGLGLAATSACGSAGEQSSATTATESKETSDVTSTESVSSQPATAAPTTSIDVPVVEPEWPEPNVADGTFGSGESFAVLSALRQIPLENGMAEDGTTEIYIADIAAASEVSGIPRPTGSTDPDEAIAWLRPLTGTDESAVFVPIPQSLRNSVGLIGEYKDEIGFAVTDVDASIEVSLPPNAMTIVAGDLEHASTVAVSDGVFTFGEGEDFTHDLEHRTVARELGRPLRAASRDQLVLLSPSTPAAESWMDLNSPRLDTVRSLAAAAEALDRQGVVGAALVQHDFSARPSLDGAETAEPVTSVTEPFSTIGLGWSAANGEGILTIVYVFTDAESAGAMVPVIETMFVSQAAPGSDSLLSERVSIALVENQQEVVVVSLRMLPDSPRPSLTLNMLYQGDSVFSYLLEDS